LRISSLFHAGFCCGILLTLGLPAEMMEDFGYSAHHLGMSRVPTNHFGIR
jgi:hypothetical protein